MIVVWLVGGLVLGGALGFALARLQSPKYRERSVPGFTILGLTLGGVAGLFLGNAVTPTPPIVVQVTATPDPLTLASRRPADIHSTIAVQPLVLHPSQTGQFEVKVRNNEAATIDQVEICLPNTVMQRLELTDPASDSPYQPGRSDGCMAFSGSVEPNSQKAFHVPFEIPDGTGNYTHVGDKVDIYLNIPDYPWNINGTIQPGPRSIHEQIVLPVFDVET